MEVEAEQLSVRWNDFRNNLTSGFTALLEDEELVDVTLSAGGHFIKAHKMVLSVCSPYFKQLFKMNPCKHPVVILKDVSYSELKNIIQFIYEGEVNINEEQITSFLKVAESLSIRGLTDCFMQRSSVCHKNTASLPPCKQMGRVVPSGESTCSEDHQELRVQPPIQTCSTPIVNNAVKEETSQPVEMTIDAEDMHDPLGVTNLNNAVKEETHRPVEMTIDNEDMHDPLGVCNSNTEANKSIREENFDSKIFGSQINPEVSTFLSSHVPQGGIISNQHQGNSFILVINEELPTDGGTARNLNTASNEELQFLETKKGQFLLVLNGCIFYRVRARAGSTYWRCKSYKPLGCSARITTRRNTRTVTTNLHNHAPHPKKLLKSKLYSIRDGYLNDEGGFDITQSLFKEQPSEQS